ncbi:MAG: MFS transporter, partial [Firmicutes bacterium]|nr:MFS transporter [Bacillota bacterium]
TGIKRSAPEKFVLVYQGDGDLASIGLAEIMHCANRGENLTVVFVNNSIFGMTGGQMAPTTLMGQKATTAKDGRTPLQGYPMHMCEILNQLTAPVYIERCALDSPAHVLAAEKAIRKGFKNQLENKGFSFIELLSNCPTNWGMSPVKSLEFMRNETMKEFPLGVFRDRSEEV